MLLLINTYASLIVAPGRERDRIRAKIYRDLTNREKLGVQEFIFYS